MTQNSLRNSFCKTLLSNECDMEGSHEWNEAIFLNDSFSVSYMTWLTMENSCYRPKSSV